ncbi:GtrA family protein [Radicibacter daui]|uniref:GtrA family protein n=1 Tax=Radicibacter daui TaxID=3064829 RepID=UPI004046D733
MTGLQTVGRYGAFAAIATAVNLALQRLVLQIVPGNPGLVLALVCGTGVGLVIKYLLDKRWIFDDRTSGLATHGRKFGLYSLMGVATTLIFWASETAFWLVWKTDLMREVGASLGLSVGYIVKYNLDRLFVFSPSPVKEEGA